MFFMEIDCLGFDLFKGSLGFVDIKFLDVMVILVVVFLQYMGKYDNFVEGLICFYMFFGFEMGVLMISDYVVVKYERIVFWVCCFICLLVYCLCIFFKVQIIWSIINMFYNVDIQ